MSDRRAVAATLMYAQPRRSTVALRGKDIKSEPIIGSVRAIMDAKAALCPPRPAEGKTELSDRETKQHEAAIEAHEHRINEAVFALYGVKGLPGE